MQATSERHAEKLSPGFNLYLHLHYGKVQQHNQRIGVSGCMITLKSNSKASLSLSYIF